jgi:hypothetical protein
MGAKFTPGPWGAIANGAAYNLHAKKYTPRHFAILLGMTYQDEGEHLANTRLIAAAPALYEAARAFRRAYAGGLTEKCDVAYKLTQAALALVDGEAGDEA